MFRVLAIDYGKVRIGLALSDETGRIAFGRQALKNDSLAPAMITKIVTEENVSRIVIGYPLSLKGGKTAQTLEVEKFETVLRKAITASDKPETEIVRWDERFTSRMAAASMLQSGMKKKKRQDKSNIDIISAAILLQSYLDSVNRTGSLPEPASSQS